MPRKTLNILWLDDKREPYYYLYKKKSDSKAFLRNKSFYNNLLSKYNANFTWVKNIDEFKNFILTNGVPDFVSFDRDLGTAPITGMDCAKWLVNYCKENGIKFPQYFIHSANVYNGQVAINNMLKNSVAENVVKLSKEDLTEMVKSVICALTEDAYINNLNTKNKTASITYQKGNSAYKRKVSNDYLDTSMMDKLDKDTYEVPLKGGITSYNITAINGTKVMHYFKNYFDRKKTIETITNRSTGKKEDYNLKMEKNEFESFKSMFIKKVDKVIQYCINNFDNKDFAKVSIYPVPSSSKFNVEMANEMAGVNFANITGGTQVINTEMFRKNLRNLEVDKDFIEKNKDYYNSPLYADNPTGETHMNSVNTTANKYKTLSSYIDMYVKYINRLVNGITTMVNADRSNMKKKNSQAQYSDTLGKRLVKFYWQLANAYEEIIEYSAYIDDFTGKEKIQYTDDQLKPLKYAKTAVNIANTDLVYELVKPYIRGLKTRNGKPIKKLPIMPVENRFSIKSMTNDIRLGLKNYFLADDEIVKQELEKIQNTVFVIFDDNISGGATLSDICLQAKNLGIQYIIPITFGKMRESYSKYGGSSITKPNNLNFS